MKLFKSAKAAALVLASYEVFMARWPVPYTEQDLQGKWGTTHVIECGKPENPPLVLFHGVGDNSAVMWELNIGALSENFHCFAVDTLGGPGKSVPNDKFKKTFNQEEWITSILDGLGLEKTNLTGVSNGAYMAYNYTVKKPERVIKTVCIEGGMNRSTKGTMWGMIKLMLPEMLCPTEKNLKKVFRKMTSPYATIYDERPDIVDHVILLMKSHNQMAMTAHKLNEYIEEEGIAQKDKLLFLAGDKKGVNMPIDHTTKEFMDKAGYHYVVVENAAHGLNQEQAETVNKLIIDWIK